MKQQKTNNKVLLTVYVGKDKQKRKYFLASNIENKTGKELLTMYMNRWDLENIFKDADRVELPTSSRNPKMRLFCVILSFFLFALWQVQTLLQHVQWSLRTFIKQIITTLGQHIRYVINSLGHIIHQPP